MLIEQAKVVSCHHGIVELESLQRSACDGCNDKGCGNGVVAKAFGRRLHRFALPDPGTLTPGQTVRIALPEQSLLGGAVLVYLTPIAMALVAALAVAGIQQLSGAEGEWLQILAAILGGCVGGLFARWRAQEYEHDPAFQIQLLTEQQIPLTLSSQRRDSDR